MTKEETKIKIAEIARDKREKLNGFKIFGLFPFFVKYLRGNTIIHLCEIQARIREANGGDNVYKDSVIDYELLKKVIPLIDEYLTIGLINSRKLGWFFKPFIKSKVRDCSESQKQSLYIMLYKLRDASFFLSYYPHLTKKDHTILKEE